MNTIASLIVKSVAIAAALTMAGAAQAAATVKLDASQLVFSSKGHNFGNTLTEARTVPVWNVSDDSSLLAFCIEPRVEMDVNKSYTGAAFTGFSDNVKRLYSLYYSSVLDTPVKALGFQLALWELNNDNGDLLSGDFALGTNFGRGKQVVGEAKTMLAGALDQGVAITNQFKFTSYSAAHSQTVVTAIAVSPVPEPSTYAMLGLGLAAIGFVARRRKA